MDIVQLRYFIAVAKCGHLTNAAKKLNVAQSALSVSIGRLEQEVGIPLFDRVGRNIYLNKYGEIYLEYAEQVLDIIQKAQREVDAYCGKNEKILNVGIVGNPISGKTLAGFMKCYPGNKVCIKKVKAENAEEELKKGNVDYVISNSGGLSAKPGLVGEVIREERLVLAVSAGHALSKREWISLKDARGEAFITAPETCGSPANTEEICREAGFEANVAIECFPCEMLELVAAGVGVALLTESWTSSSCCSGQVVFLPVRNPSYMRYDYITWQAGRRFSKMAKAFRKFLIDYYEHSEGAECGICPQKEG